MSVVEALSGVRARIQTLSNAVAGSRVVRLVAVSKTKPPSAVKECYDAGQRHFGENYVQELCEKSSQLPADVRWHFIGHLQSNKAKVITQLPSLYMIESIDSVKLANQVNKYLLPAADRVFGGKDEGRLRVMVQVNTSGEANKSGVEPGPAVTELCRHVASKCSRLRLVGLMTIGKLGEKEPECFRTLVRCRDEVLAAKIEGVPQTAEEFDLSMGMSGDFDVAIKLGSTNVRIGSTIFGAREYTASKPKTSAPTQAPNPLRLTLPSSPKDAAQGTSGDAITVRLQKLDLEKMTPMEAIKELVELQKLANEQQTTTTTT